MTAPDPPVSFDPLAVPLERQQFIEASAGTGKTYSIAGLFLRLVLEAGLPVERILVVTYTNAATAELRERIRLRLVELRAALAGGTPADDLIGRLVDRVTDRVVASRRLDAAVLGFNAAAVHTIHGFCQRALAEHAFASGVPFERELVPDPSAPLREMAEDCWRREVYGADAEFVAWLLARKQGPEAWFAFLRDYVGKPYLQVRLPPAPSDDAAAALAAALAAMQRHYERDTVMDLLLNSGLHATHYKADPITSLCDEVERWLTAGQPPSVLPPLFDRLCPAKIESSVTKKSTRRPAHAFFDACATFARRFAEVEMQRQWRLAHLRARLLGEARTALDAAKRRRREFAYDDLLLDLDAALHAPGGERLAAALRQRFPAAMVDEFQDTDPVQYRILRAVYGTTSLPLFLVGDPKQAIYRFRGADVFAYLAGGEQAAGRHTLAHNWRSVPALIDGVNTLFAARDDAFVLDGIGFAPAQAATRDHDVLLVDDQPAGPPLRLWYTPDGPKPLGKTACNGLAARATAAEIARLLGPSGARLGDRPLAGGDIAVLVPTHRQGGLVRDALRGRGVQSVQLSGESVFASPEAGELARLLAAIAEPARESLLRAALLTDALGGDGALLQRLQEDETLLQHWLDRLGAWHRDWQEHGLLPVLRALFESERVGVRLLALPEGERRLTNLQHLAELLQQGPVASGLGPAATLKWLAARIERAAEGGRAEDEVQELRLESDENLVNIVTIHRSKGLQYPVVFCPFLWDAKTPRGEPDRVDWHDPAATPAHVLDLGSDGFAAARDGAALERLAESVRLAYVALTRAEHRCYVMAPSVAGFADSALGWLLAAADDTPLADRLSALAAAHPHAIAVETPATEAPPLARDAGDGIVLAARTPAGPVRSRRVIGSFSSLARGHAADRPDHDAGVALPAVAAETRVGPRGIFAFPRGARAGTCLHAVFEDLDFAQAAAAGGRDVLERRAAETLRRHGFGAEWSGVVADMVRDVLATPLGADDPRLADVPRGRCLHELEFCFPVERLRAAPLAALLARHGLPPLPGADGGGFAPLAGYLKGFMDLVFEHGGRWYLVDWKSNWLGASADDYATARLAPAMAREGYHLQYLVYTVALHRWLRLRLPGYDYDTHFGGVRYLFLRGMQPARGATTGVFATRPPRGLVEALDTLMRAAEAA